MKQQHIHLRCSQELLDDLDELQERLDTDTKSAAIRHAVRTLLSQTGGRRND